MYIFYMSLLFLDMTLKWKPSNWISCGTFLDNVNYHQWLMHKKKWTLSITVDKYFSYTVIIRCNEFMICIKQVLDISYFPSIVKWKILYVNLYYWFVKLLILFYFNSLGRLWHWCILSTSHSDDIHVSPTSSHDHKLE